MVHNILNGFFRANIEAIQYWNTSMNTCMPNITAIIFAKEISIVPVCPETVIIRNIPNM